ncbi:hypothetical protein D3C73_1001780 [compost metagenome]
MIKKKSTRIAKKELITAITKAKLRVFSAFLLSSATELTATIVQLERGMELEFNKNDSWSIRIVVWDSLV